MEMRPKFEVTDPGPLPRDWCLRRIGEIGEVRGRVGWKGYTKNDLVGFGPYVIGGKHIDDDCRLDLSDPTFLSRDKYLESPEITVQRGDILLAQRGTLGKLALVENDIGEATINPSMVIVRTIGVSPSFVRYFLLSREGQRQITLAASATSVPMISQKQIENFQISLPPTVEEQDAIATALSGADELIEGLTRLTVKKRDLKQAAMQQLLTGRTRLPGFNAKWHVKPLGEMAEMVSGGTPASLVPAYFGGDIAWVSISDMTRAGKFIERTERTLTQLGFDSCSARMYGGGTVLYAMYASLGECSIATTPLCSSQAILGISPGPALDCEFLYYYLQSIKPAVKLLAQHGTQSNLNKEMVQAFQLPVPPANEQTAIATVLADMDAELAAIEARRAKTQALKQAMMQSLLTGRIRLVTPEPAHA